MPVTKLAMNKRSFYSSFCCYFKQKVCILEAMKLMNELESEVSGEVIEILVENGTPVEFGEVLMRVKPG